MLRLDTVERHGGQLLVQWPGICKTWEQLAFLTTPTIGLYVCVSHPHKRDNSPYFPTPLGIVRVNTLNAARCSDTMVRVRYQG